MISTSSIREFEMAKFIEGFADGIAVGMVVAMVVAVAAFAPLVLS